MGFWDDATEWFSDVWDGVTDWWDGDRPASEGELGDDGELSQVPPKDDVREKLTSIKPVLLEGYRREEAYRRCPLSIYRQHNDSLNFREEAGGYSHVSDFERGELLLGFYRWSDTLDFYMPADPPAAVKDEYELSGPISLEYWRPSTATDDADIDSTAKSKTETAMSEINSAYEDVLEQCDVPTMAELVSLLESVREQMDSIHETHYDSECKQVKDLWLEWEGDDADAAVETFGNHFRQAVEDHKGAAKYLEWAACCEASSQASAMIAAYNHGIRARELINEKIYPSSSGQEQAASKLTGTIVVNRIPYLGDAVALTDFLVEAATDGKVESPVSGTINGLADRLSDGKDVPDEETCEELVSMLTSGAQDCLDLLDDDRSEYSNIALKTESDNLNEHWDNGTVHTIIPGYLD